MPGSDQDLTLARLLENNRKWAERTAKERPGFFERLAAQQAPEILWIGCSDSRVPANQIIDVLPGEVFVHRNIANQVMHVDFNCLAVVQYAVEALGVRHIIVCGHYGCGGVTAALQPRQTSLIGNWLHPLFELGMRHHAELEAVRESDRVDALCEINVVEQVRHVCQTAILERAWHRGQNITVHGWIYGIHNGRLSDLEVTVSGPGEVEHVFAQALSRPRLVDRFSS